MERTDTLVLDDLLTTYTFTEVLDAIASIAGQRARYMVNTLDDVRSAKYFASIQEALENLVLPC